MFCNVCVTASLVVILLGRPPVTYTCCIYSVCVIEGTEDSVSVFLDVMIVVSMFVNKGIQVVWVRSMLHKL